MRSSFWWQTPLPLENWEEAGFGIYVHWPFCQSKCPYCDFNSHVRSSIDQERWRNALLTELAHSAEEWPGRTVDSIFFGGGTPSLMDPETVAAVISAVGQHWVLRDGAEISLEANPGSVEAGRFADYSAAGVNRISMGIQSLRDDDLRRLGRLHTAAEARAAFDIARARFERVSFDLIYARQNQSIDAWTAELKEAVAMAVDHLSLYQLTIEPGTRFYDLAQRGGLRGLPNDEIAADMFEATRSLCRDEGLPAYEVSNHARPGAECRHNRIYWQCGDYLGIGPGAHGFASSGASRWAMETEPHPENWLKSVETSGTGNIRRSAVSPQDQAENYLMMGLRLSDGVDLARYRRLGGGSISVSSFEETGLLKKEADQLFLCEAGYPVLNYIIKSIID